LTGALLTTPTTAVAAGGAEPSTHVRPYHGEVERFLVVGSTGHCRPIGDIHGVDFVALKPLVGLKQDA
jgi:hypothetical protein